MSAPRYSVVIPTYNRRDTLLRVVGALERLEEPERMAELVVVDDGSDDGTPEAVRALRPSFPLRLVESARGGPGAARNRGVEVARGDRVLFLCDDIEPTPRLLRLHAERSAGEAEPHAVVGRVDWPPGVSVTWFMRWVIERYHFGFGALEGRGELPAGSFIAANLSISRDVFRSLGGFDESFPYGFEDTDLGLRFIRAGGRILYAPEALGLHHHEMSLASYCRRQEMVGRSAVHFAAKYQDLPAVTALDRTPTWHTLRGAAKKALVNRATLPIWRHAALLLAGVGAEGVAGWCASRVLAYHYYRGAQGAIRRRPG